ncbi:MAG: cation:proton antiporter [Minisyncoccia bacterium]
MDTLFLQISSLLAITVGIAFITRLLRQPLIIAYIFAGIICGPFILNLFHGESDLYNTFAQFGVVLLLFIIGLNLNFNHLKSIGKISFITGIGQVVFTASIGLAILLALGLTTVPALYLAIAITFSSTIIIMKLLSDKKDTDSVYGRYTIGLMLVQDVIAVLIIIVLGMTTGDHAAGLEGIVTFGAKLLAIGACLFLASRYLLPKLLGRIAHSSELLFLFTLAWCFGAASILYAAGFSLEIGAIIAGMALSSSPYQLEIGSRIRPLRDFFLIIFFIVLGSEMGLSSMADVAVPAGVLSLFILIGNPIILYVLFRKLKFTRRNSFLSGVTAAQVSEFGFVVLFAGRQAGHIQSNEVVIFSAVALVTIFVSSYMITYSEQIYRALLPVFRMFGPDKYQQNERPPERYDAWIVGYHRIGAKVAESMKEMGTSYAVIDFDPKIAQTLSESTVPFYFGDIADVEFLESVPIGSAKMVVMTIPAVDDQINLIKHVRSRNADIVIVANAYHHKDASRLYEHGANFVMMPHLIGADWITKILRGKVLDEKAFRELRTEQEALTA